MDRFVYPLTPLILIYLFIGLGLIPKIKNHLIKIYFFLIFLLLSVSLQSLSYIYERHKVGSDIFDEDITNIVDYYEIDNFNMAVTLAINWNKTINVISELDNIIGSNDLTLSIKPQLVTYLSGLHVESLPRINKRNVEHDDIDVWFTYIKKKVRTIFF